MVKKPQKMEEKEKQEDKAQDNSPLTTGK